MFHQSIQMTGTTPRKRIKQIPSLIRGKKVTRFIHAKNDGNFKSFATIIPVCLSGIHVPFLGKLTTHHNGKGLVKNKKAKMLYTA